MATDSTSLVDLQRAVEVPDPSFEDLAVITPRSQVAKGARSEKQTFIDPLYAAVFYSSFWPSHPFLPSSRDIQGHLDGNEGASLVYAINYIGSLYACAGNNHLQPINIAQDLREHPQNGFAVQGLILLAISSHMCNNPTQAQGFLQNAIEIALAIGLHKHEFSANNGKENCATTESWRRTWWELYILDIMFAGLNQTSNMWLKDVESDVLLPCEETEYLSKNVVSTDIHLFLFLLIDPRFSGSPDG